MAVSWAIMSSYVRVCVQTSAGVEMVMRAVAYAGGFSRAGEQYYPGRLENISISRENFSFYIIKGGGGHVAPSTITNRNRFTKEMCL
jgi:hypothetical protein